MFFSGGSGSSFNTDRSLLNPNLSFSHPAVTLNCFLTVQGFCFCLAKCQGLSADDSLI